MNRLEQLLSQLKHQDFKQRVDAVNHLMVLANKQPSDRKIIFPVLIKIMNSDPHKEVRDTSSRALKLFSLASGLQYQKFLDMYAEK
jgi:hypothetical protein